MNETDALTTESEGFFSTAFMLGNVGAPFLIGLALGYFAKKMLKIALLIGGAALVLMIVGEYYGVLTIDEAQLQAAADTATTLANSSGNFLLERLSTLTTRGASATAGFFLGLKIG